MPHPTPENNSEKTTHFSKIIGATLASIAELAVFHPFGTAAVRIQNHKGKLINPWQPLTSMANVGRIANTGGNPYAGFTVGALDRFCKRIYKFSVQGILVENVLTPYAAPSINRIVGDKNSKPAIEALAGGLTGIGEIAFLPFDNIKINKQVNSRAYAQLGTTQNLFQIFRDQGLSLYKGATTTALRNFFGSSLLFGASSACYTYGFKLDNRRQATRIQDITASIVGSSASVFLTLPLDVIKTRLQIANKRSRTPENSLPSTGLSTAKKMLQEEGVSAFFKGAGIKTITSVAKLAFALTVARRITFWVDSKFSEHQTNSTPPRDSPKHRQ